MGRVKSKKFGLPWSSSRGWILKDYLFKKPYNRLWAQRCLGLAGYICAPLRSGVRLGYLTDLREWRHWSILSVSSARKLLIQGLMEHR